MACCNQSISRSSDARSSIFNEVVLQYFLLILTRIRPGQLAAILFASVAQPLMQDLKNYYGLVFQFQQYRLVINLKERNLGTKEKSPKQGLASAKNLTVNLNEGRDLIYHRLDYI